MVSKTIGLGSSPSRCANYIISTVSLNGTRGNINLNLDHRNMVYFYWEELKGTRKDIYKASWRVRQCLYKRGD